MAMPDIPLLLVEVQCYIAFGERQRAAERTVGAEAKVMFWTGYLMALRTVEQSVEQYMAGVCSPQKEIVAAAEAQGESP